MGTGSITRRGANSWRLKFDLDRDASGKRRTQFLTVRGTKKEAQAALNEKLTEVARGEFVGRSMATVADYAGHWLTAIAPSQAGAKTLERYRELVDTHIIPQLGAIKLQRLDGSRIDEFYAHLGTKGRRDGKGGLAPQTVRHIHRLLSQILRSAVKAGKLRQSPMMAVQTTPKVRKQEIQILTAEELATLYRHLSGRPLRMPVILAANTGMRRGEVLAVRWKDIDFDTATLTVAQVIEKTRKSVALKEPKTDRSRRAISLGPELVSLLRAHKGEQSKQRLALGLGKDPLDLVFPSWEGELQNPEHFTKAFAREVVAAGIPRVTFQRLRHTHLTHLLLDGIPVHVVSARAGHANPTVTLNVYSHMLPGAQDGAAAIADAALKAALQE